jgi:hypothetical protein
MLKLFVSIDLVGSTKFKANPPSSFPPSFSPKGYSPISSPDNWVEWYKHILLMLIELPNSHLLDYTVWKIQGDEVIYSIDIQNKESLIKTLSTFYRSLGFASSFVRPMSQESLDVKAAAWLAFIDEQHNVTIRDNPMEYVGISFDEGFRVAGAFAKKRMFAVTFEIAKIVSTQTPQFIHLLKFERLKGVWNDRGYPVLWYSENPSDEMYGWDYDVELDSDLYSCFKKKVQLDSSGGVSGIEPQEQIMMKIENSLSGRAKSHWDLIKAKLGIS